MVHELSKDFILENNIAYNIEKINIFLIKLKYINIGDNNMFFHFVKEGDTLSSIANNYNIDLQKLINDNSLKDPNDLVINQCLLIAPNDFEYIVKQGDTLSSISKKYHISIDKLKNENNITDFLSIGQTLKIKYSTRDKPTKWINAYCYNESSLNALKNALNSLTSLSIFSYQIDLDGNLSSSNDVDIIKLAKEYNVSPIMVITNSKAKGGFSPSIAKEILNNSSKQETLLTKIINIMKNKGYEGLNIDFEYINPEDKNAYISFLKKAKDVLHQNKFYLTVALAPKYSSSQKGLLYEAHDYNDIGRIADLIVLMTYEWGYTYGPSMPVSPYNEVKKVLDYAKREIPSNKILMGLPNYGYIFKLPYKEKQKAESIKNNKAPELAYKNKVSYKYNSISRTPYFRYKINDIEYEVQFDNPYSISEKITLLDDLNIRGLSIWTISSCCNYYYLLIDNYFKVEKNPN